MEIETDNLVIRSFSSDDIDDYASIVADPEVMRYLGDTVDSDSAAEYVADCIIRDQTSGISRYAVTERSDGKFIGFCGFKSLTGDYGNQVPEGTPWIDFGWRYRRSAWRKGFGFEAASAVYEYGKRQLDLSNIEARAHRDNIGSLRIIEKLGFQWMHDYESPVGVFRRYREA